MLSSFSFFNRLNLSKLYYAYFKFLNASITHAIARTRPQGIKKETKKPPPDKTHSPTVISLGPPNCTINVRKNTAHTAIPTTPKKRAENLKPPFIPFPFLRGSSLDLSAHRSLIPHLLSTFHPGPLPCSFVNPFIAQDNFPSQLKATHYIISIYWNFPQRFRRITDNDTQVVLTSWTGAVEVFGHR